VPGSAKAATQICSNQAGTNGGSYYQMWSSGQGSACITLNSGNSYSTAWSAVGDFVAGVGSNPGTTSAKTFSSSLSANGGTTLISLYGWSTNPLVEYYVEENYSGSPNTAGTYMGQMTSDGGTYNIYEHQQVNQPGTMNYQILATEAWGGGSGSDSVTLNNGGGGGGGGGGSGGCTATLSAGSQGSNWYNLNVSVTGSSTWTVTMNMASPATVYSTRNVNASYPSQYQLVATPNGNGNNWGVTISPNGQWTWPTVTCSTG
jgi:endo-1,4-beta-xylanase